MAYFRLNDGSDSIESEHPHKKIWDLLVKKTIEAGHALTFDEARADPKFINPNEFAVHFGKRFSDWAKEAWRTVIIEQEDSMKKVHTRESIIADIRRFCEVNKRFPTQQELNLRPDLPGYGVVYRELGASEKWLKEVYGDEEPPFEVKKASSVTPSTPEAETFQEIGATQDAATPVETAERVEIVEKPRLETKKPKNKKPTPPGDAVAKHPADGQSAGQVVTTNGVTTIELKISLPTRETPISLNLSF